MATRLNKDVVREVRLVRGAVIVTLTKGGTIRFREKGRRRCFELLLDSVFVRAVDATIAREKAERRAQRRADRS